MKGSILYEQTSDTHTLSLHFGHASDKIETILFRQVDPNAPIEFKDCRAI